MAKKVLYLFDTLGRGGAEQALVNLLPGMKTLGYECEVAYLMPPSTLVCQIKALNIPVHGLNLLHGWSVPEAVWKLTALCKKNKYDVVHSFVFFAPNTLGVSRRFLKKTLCVASVASPEFERTLANTAWQKVRRNFRLRILREALDGLIANSERVQEHYRKYLGDSKISVIEYPVPVNCFELAGKVDRIQTRKQYGVSEKEFLILGPSRFIPNEGLGNFLEALTHLPFNSGLWKVILFSDEKSIQALNRQLKELGLERYVSVLPQLIEEELFPLMVCSDVVVFPSLSEGYCLAVSEAMALGCTVVAARVGGIEQIIRHEESGFLFGPGDPQCLARYLIRLYSSLELRRKVSQAACAEAKSRFNVLDLAKRTVEFYVLIRQSRVPPCP